MRGTAEAVIPLERDNVIADASARRKFDAMTTAQRMRK